MSIVINATRTVAGLALLSGVSIAANNATHEFSLDIQSCLSQPPHAQVCVTHDGGVGLLKTGTPVHTLVWLYWDGGMPHITRGDG